MSALGLTQLLKELQTLEKSMQLLQQLRAGQISLPSLVVQPGVSVPEELHDIDAAISAAEPVTLDLEAAIRNWTTEDQQKYREALLLPVARLVHAQHKLVVKEVHAMASRILQLPPDPTVGG